MLRRPLESTQFVALAFGQTLRRERIAQSMGSKGDCYDNAAMETFWSTLKREIRWIRGSLRFPTRAAARLYLFEYIEIFYNRQRHQTALGHLTPLEHRERFAS